MDKSPAEIAPTTADLQTCYIHTGALANGEHLLVRCPDATYGRYVVITIPGDTETLSLCEVEVFGCGEYDDKENIFVILTMKANAMS